VSFLGVHFRIIEAESMVEIIGEDWSQVRSPARARRRRRRYPQRIRTLYAPRKDAYQMPDGRGGFVYVMHPVTAVEFRRLLREQTRVMP
jgi:hypothetical protein